LQPVEQAQGVSWGSAAAEIRDYGIQRTTHAIRYAKERGIAPEDLLEALRTCRANERLFARPQAALVEWCRSGEWPAEGVQDWRAKEQAQQRQAQRRTEAAWKSRYLDALKIVRAETPRGQYVSDERVVQVAVKLGVPLNVAMAESGMEATRETASV